MQVEKNISNSQTCQRRTPEFHVDLKWLGIHELHEWHYYMRATIPPPTLGEMSWQEVKNSRKDAKETMVGLVCSARFDRVRLSRRSTRPLNGKHDDKPSGSAAQYL
jgi:hypothetical protein